MKKTFKYIFIIMILIFLSVSQNAYSVQIGGEIELRSELYYRDKFSAGLQGTSQLEFFLPHTENLQPRLVLRGYLTERGADLAFKYLYLRYRTDSGHLTLGRQPVSWSYGAIFNPLDFSFAIEDLAGMSLRPEVDAVRYFHYLQDNKSLQLVGSFPEGLSQQPFDRMGYGVRLRLPGRGYDFSFNAIRQPLEPSAAASPPQPADNLLRAGATYSGDIGQMGIYGALAYYYMQQAEEKDILAQIGMDYSWSIGPRYQQRRLFVQAEYLKFLEENLGLPLLLQSIDNGQVMAAGNNNLSDLFILNSFIQLDRFSQLGAAVVADTGDLPLSFVPFYQTDLGGGLELRIDSNIMLDNNDDITTAISAGFKYYF